MGNKWNQTAKIEAFQSQKNWFRETNEKFGILRSLKFSIKLLHFKREKEGKVM